VLTSTGRVNVQFGPIGRRPPFADQTLREQLRDRLLTIPGVELPPVVEARRPSFDLELLAGAQLTRFTAAMDWAYEQANAAAGRRPSSS
jgi:hypothetical protein